VTPRTPRFSGPADPPSPPLTPQIVAAQGRRDLVRSRWRKVVQQQMLLLRLEAENTRLDAARSRSASIPVCLRACGWCVRVCVCVCLPLVCLCAIQLTKQQSVVAEDEVVLATWQQLLARPPSSCSDDEARAAVLAGA
jgi:hypothetical protein